MSLREFFVERRRAEQPVFLKVLKALPQEKLSYKSHERGPSAEQIVCTLTGELQSCLDAVTTHRAEWQSVPPRPLPTMIKEFEERSTELTDRVAKLTDAEWESKAQFFYGGKMVSEQTLREFLWMVHFDSIHHRGQLTAYLRPMGGRVPAIYGPSADDSGKA